MNRRILPNRRFSLRGLAALVGAFLVLAAAPAALANWITIDTNDGLEGNFGAPLYTSTCSNASIADHVEIKRAWIANDGTSLYFKLELCGTTRNYTYVRYVGGLDCTNDGDTDDADTANALGDRKVVHVPALDGGGDQVNLVDGSNKMLDQLPTNDASERIGTTAIFEWQMPLQYIYPECRASISAIPMGLGTGLTNSFPPTKDTTPLHPWSIPIDYGDAINPGLETRTCTEYPTRIPCEGARHGLNSPLKLGSLIDADTGGANDADALTDDITGLTDEDGVAPTAGVNWVPGGQASLSATVSGGSGYLNCWVDWNNDKDWADADEKVVSDVSAAAGLNTVTFAMPGGISFPNSFVARCRLSPGANQGAAVTGAVEFGEVEDHRWHFGATGNRPALVAVSAGINGADVRLSWTDIASNESYLVLSSAQPYFNPGDAGVTTTVDPDNVSPYDVAGILGGAADVQFFSVQGQVTSSLSPTPLISAPSNHTGLFEFPLTAGVQ